jgi:hypothetical protein
MTTDTGAVPIYITAGVTETEAAEAVEYLNAAYEYVKTSCPDTYTLLDTRVKAIRIVSGENKCEPDGNGKYIIELQKGETKNNFIGVIQAILMANLIV